MTLSHVLSILFRSLKLVLMPRHQINKVDYFPHIANQGKTLFILQRQYGNNGYAFWFKLLEILTSSENHFYNASDETEWQYLVAYTGVTDVSATEMLTLLSKLGKIDSELWQNSRIIWCQSLVEHFSEVYRKRGRAIPSKPICDRNNNNCDRNKGTAEITATGIPQRKVKYSRVKNIKERSIEEIPSPPAQVIKAPDFIDSIIQLFAEAYEQANGLAYVPVSPGKERAAVGKLLSAFNKKYPDLDSEEAIIEALRVFFDMAVRIDNDWLRTNMSLSILVSKFNEINNILRNGKSRNNSGATNAELAELLANKLGTDAKK